MTNFFPCVSCGWVAWDPPRGICYACRALGNQAGPGAFAPLDPGGGATSTCPPGTHVLWLSPDKTLVEGLVKEARGEESLIQLADGSTRWVKQTTLARDVPAAMVEEDAAGFDLSAGALDGATEERDELELVASIGARCCQPRVRGNIARVTGSAFLRWSLPLPVAGTVPYLDVRWCSVERGGVVLGVRRPDGRVASARAVPGRPVLMTAPTVLDADGHARLRLAAGPEGAEGLTYEVWLMFGSA